MITKICNALTTIILVAVMAVLALLFLPKVFGYQVYGVLSGSMEPHFHVGSVVYVKPAAPAEVQVGDPITFQLPSNREVVATHRVVDIDQTAQTFQTKGDANEAPDAEPIPFSRLIGRAVFSVPLIGYLSLALKTKQGLIAGVGVFIFVIFLSLLGSLMDPKNKEKAPAGGKSNWKEG